VKYKILCVIALGCFLLFGCSSKEIVVPSTSPNDQITIENPQSEYDAPPCFGTKLIYERKMDGNMIVPPSWLTGSLVGWVSETDNMEGKSYQGLHNPRSRQVPLRQ